jgi:hypothetical protein
MLEDLTESIHGSTVVARTQLPRHSVSATLHCCTACTYRTLTAAGQLHSCCQFAQSLHCKMNQRLPRARSIRKRTH